MVPPPYYQPKPVAGKYQPFYVIAGARLPTGQGLAQDRKEVKIEGPGPPPEGRGRGGGGGGGGGGDESDDEDEDSNMDGSEPKEFHANGFASQTFPHTSMFFDTPEEEMRGFNGSIVSPSTGTGSLYSPSSEYPSSAYHSAHSQRRSSTFTASSRHSTNFTASRRSSMIDDGGPENVLHFNGQETFTVADSLPGVRHTAQSAIRFPDHDLHGREDFLGGGRPAQLQYDLQLDGTPGDRRPSIVAAEERFNEYRRIYPDLPTDVIDILAQPAGRRGSIQSLPRYSPAPPVYTPPATRLVINTSDSRAAERPAPQSPGTPGPPLIGRRRRNSEGGGGGKRRRLRMDNPLKRRRRSIGDDLPHPKRLAVEIKPQLIINTNVPKSKGPTRRRVREGRPMDESIPIPRVQRKKPEPKPKGVSKKSTKKDKKDKKK